MNINRPIRNVDDAADLISSLKRAKHLNGARDALVRAVIYLRTERQLKGEKTESIARLELSIKEYLRYYNGHDFEEVYPAVREMVRLIPKFQIFGIDITELRDIAHAFDAAYRYDSTFSSIASDIRMLTHRNLSEKVITKIELFEAFLHSDDDSALIDGSTVTGAARGAKDDLLYSEIFTQLLKLKDLLKMAWTGNNGQREKMYSPAEFVRIVREIINDLSREEISTMPGYILFLDYFVESLEGLRAFRLEDISIGKIRFYLKEFIAQITGAQVQNKEHILFRLITIETLLEQVSFIYYSNIVNAEKNSVTDGNYLDTLKILFELALCARAAGFGTRHLDRFAFLLENILKQMKERPDRAAHFPTIIDAMNSNLENYFYYLQKLYSRNIDNPEPEIKIALLNRILNNLIREKTTHLLSNMINNLKRYLEQKEKERFNRLLGALEGLQDFNIGNFVYGFGIDVPPVEGVARSPEFMGGKGFSLVTSSRLIDENRLAGIGVPVGSGFSTLTWHFIKNNEERMDGFRSQLRAIIEGIEKRTGKIFSSGKNPLLLMARSGAVISMPGILDTTSHIGLNMESAVSWSRELDEPARAFHAYMSFLLSYARSVLALNPDDVIRAAGFYGYEDMYSIDSTMAHDHARLILNTIQGMSPLKEEAVPGDPFSQLYLSALAVFRSFEKEIVYSQAASYGIPEEFQTSCVIQECLPILNGADCSGVFFTRNPATGKKGHQHQEHIEYRDGYFGNVIADGAVRPSTTGEFIAGHPAQYEVLKTFKYHDEREQRYPTDIEFAVRNGIVYIVQSRILKQSPTAMIINSYNFFKEGIYSPFKLIKRTAFSFNKEIIETYIDVKAVKKAAVIARGRPVNGGAVSGRVIKDHNNINTWDGRLIFITESNVPPNVIIREQKIAGYISKEGGVTSHAALVAISERKPCVTDVQWAPGDGDRIVAGGFILHEGEYITLDANSGNIYRGRIPIIESGPADEEYRDVRKKIIGVIEEFMSEG